MCRSAQGACTKLMQIWFAEPYRGCAPRIPRGQAPRAHRRCRVKSTGRLAPREAAAPPCRASVLPPRHRRGRPRQAPRVSKARPSRATAKEPQACCGQPRRAASPLRIERDRALGKEIVGAVQNLDQSLGALLQARERTLQLAPAIRTELGCEL